MKRFISCTAIAVLLTYAAGCAAWRNEAQERAISPALSQAWPGVMYDASLAADEPAEQSAVSVMGEAIASGSCAEAARVAEVVWPEVERLAIEGVALQLASEEIGPGVSQSKVERIRLFGEAVMVCGEPTDPSVK